MKIYVFTITYNFDTDAVVKKCDTYYEALQMLKDYLENEVQNIRYEKEYEPSVLDWSAHDVTLVYAEGYDTDCGNEYGVEDCAYYRIFEVEI